MHYQAHTRPVKGMYSLANRHHIKNKEQSIWYWQQLMEKHDFYKKNINFPQCLES
jgi:hypothetical protein